MISFIDLIQHLKEKIYYIYQLNFINTKNLIYTYYLTLKNI